MEPTTKDVLSLTLLEIEDMPLKQYRRALLQHEYSKGSNISYEMAIQILHQKENAELGQRVFVLQIVVIVLAVVSIVVGILQIVK
jgi:hypothetical protein